MAFGLFAIIYLWVGASLIARLVKNPPAMQETLVGWIPGLGRSAREGVGYLLQYSYSSPVFLDFSCGSADKESACRLITLQYCSGFCHTLK